jgi:thioredoxin reductase (NADPH)
VVGAGNSAGQTALHLAKYAARVTLLVRGNALAKSMSDYLVKGIGRTENIDVRLNTRVVGAQGARQLAGLVIENVATGVAETVPAAALFILIGAEPRTDWLSQALARDEKGYILTGRDLAQRDEALTMWPLDRPPLLLETSMPGVFAVGDVRHGAVQRVASAVGEGSIAIRFVHEYLSEGTAVGRTRQATAEASPVKHSG